MTYLEIAKAALGAESGSMDHGIHQSHTAGRFRPSSATAAESWRLGVFGYFRVVTATYD